MTKVNISFSIGDKTVTVERDFQGNPNLKEEVEKLLLEIENIGTNGMATAGQMRALYGKALDRGWDKEKIGKFLEANIGTSDENEIVGKVERLKLSRLIDEIGGAVEVPGKVTVGQMRALWGKTLDKGWNRDKIRKFLETKLGTSKEEEIVGKINKEVFSRIIDEVEDVQ